MITHNLGYPRIGNNRELKKAVEAYWTGSISYEQLWQVGSAVRKENWLLQKKSGVDLVPSNDFSFYDHILDMTLALGAVPKRYAQLPRNSDRTKLDLYFAMARGVQLGDTDIIAMEMTKWFDTNYHYIVPEFNRNQKFGLTDFKFINEFLEAKQLGIITKPVLIGPVSYLLLGKEKESGFDRIDLLEDLLPVYFDMLTLLAGNGAHWIQLDEPFLALDLTPRQKEAFQKAYTAIRKNFPDLKILLSVYFGGLQDNAELVAGLPVDAIHLDLVRDPAQLEIVMNLVSEEKKLSLGLVDGRNIWKNNFEDSLTQISKAINKVGKNRLMLAPSCSLLHVPCDLKAETNEMVLPSEIKQWLAFARQKTEEVVTLKQIALNKDDIAVKKILEENQKTNENRKSSRLIHNDQVKERMESLEQFRNMVRKPFSDRKKCQQQQLHLPPFPTTTIGSFPQTSEVRSWRAKLKRKELSPEEYNRLIRSRLKGQFTGRRRLGLTFWFMVNLNEMIWSNILVKGFKVSCLVRTAGFRAMEPGV